MKRSLALSFLVLSLACFSGAIAAVHDCSKGCLANVKPVCSVDGSIQFINRCLADCQGVSAVDGACKGANAMQSVLAGSSAAGLPWVFPKALNRYASSGYKLVGFLPRVAIKPAAAADVIMELRDSPGTSGGLVRVSMADGGVYILPAAAAAGSSSIPAAEAAAESSPISRRHLRGATAATDATAAPRASLAAVGQLEAGSSWRCSATLIGPGTILTAAHCVYDRGDASGKAVLPKELTFAPGRYMPPGGSAPEDPFGASKVSHCTFGRQYLPDSSDVTSMWDHDVAVCQLEDATMGQRAGVMRVEPSEGPFKAPVRHAGYPEAAGQPSGVLSVSGCILNVEPADIVSTSVVAHHCDSTQGESGAPLYEAETKTVRAVAVYEVAGQYNAAALITQQLYNTLVLPSLAK